MSMVGTGFPTFDEILADIKVLQMENEILSNFPTAAPLVSMTNRLGKTREVKSPEFKWLTDEPGPRTVATDAAFDHADLTISVPAGKGKFFEPHKTFMGENGVMFRAVSVTYNTGGGGSHDFITFQKTDATALSDSTNMNSGALLYLMPDAVGDKQDAMEGYTDEPVPVEGYAQNFQTAVSISTIADWTELYGGDRRKIDHAKRQVEIAQQVELAWFLSKKWKGTGAEGKGTVWTLGGIRQAISTNIFDLNNATVTEDLLLACIPQALDYADISNLALFVTSAFKAKFATFGAGKLMVKPDDKRWGFAPVVWITPYGEIPLIHSKVLDPWKDGAEVFLLDTSEFKKVNTPGGAIKLMPNRQNPREYQKILDLYVGMYGFQWGREKFQSMFTNFKYS